MINIEQRPTDKQKIGDWRDYRRALTLQIWADYLGRSVVDLVSETIHDTAGTEFSEFTRDPFVY